LASRERKYIVMKRISTVVGVAGAVLLALSMAACGEKEEGNTGSAAPAPSSTVDQALAAKVPDAIKADGVIKIGTDSTYAPAEFLDTDGKTVIGFDVDLFNAIAAKLGLKTEWVSSSFDDIIPGVVSGKYEAGVSSFTIRNDRKSQVHMISYFLAGTQWVTQKGNPKSVDPDNACGKRIAVQNATVQLDDIKARSKKCTDAGKPAITIEPYTGQDEATSAVATGKDDAMLADLPPSVDAVRKNPDKLELLGENYDSAPYGFVVAKDQQAFAEAIQGALKQVIAEGTYDAILKHWNVEGGKLTGEPEIDPQTAE